MGKVILTVTVDWEGRALIDKSIAEMEKFNSTFPGVPLTHFICPAYFTRGEDNSKITNIIGSVIKKNDEIGLHIHCWQTLVENAKVGYQPTPTIIVGDKPGNCVPYGNQKEDCGQYVPLGIYSDNEILAIIGSAEELLAKSGLIGSVAESVSFRCGMWVASTNVLEALAKSTLFQFDASSVDGTYLMKTMGPSSPQIKWNWLVSLWGAALTRDPQYLRNTLTQPKYPAGISGLQPGDGISQPTTITDKKLIEIPDSGALADYTSQNTLEEYVQRSLDSAVGGDIYISFGFHQETASSTSSFDAPQTNLDVVASTLQKFQGNSSIEYLTVRAAGERFKKTLTDLSSERIDLPL